MSTIYKCPSCGASLAVPESKVGFLLKCPRCDSTFTAAPHPQRAESPEQIGGFSIDTSQKPIRVQQNTTRPNSWLRRYMHWSGTRSFIFQTLLAAWTAFMLMVLCLFMLSAVQAARESRDDNFGFRRRSEGADGFALLVAIACPMSVYALVAIPLGVGALATLESNKVESNQDI